MIITITPEDILKRALWGDYKKFALRENNEEQLRTIVAENKPISISEELGYVIGLLKVIETDNLVHRFSTHFSEILKIKSTIFPSPNGSGDKNVYISIKVIENELISFRKRFPDYWKADNNYEKAIKELNIYIDKIENAIKTFEIFEFKVKDKKVKYYQSKDLKKLIEE